MFPVGKNMLALTKFRFNNIYFNTYFLLVKTKLFSQKNKMANLYFEDINIFSLHNNKNSRCFFLFFYLFFLYCCYYLHTPRESVSPYKGLNKKN